MPGSSSEEWTSRAMSDFARTKEDIIHECGILPSDFITAGAKDKLVLLACMTPEQAFRLGHVVGMGKGLEIESGSASINAYKHDWHIKERT